VEHGFDSDRCHPNRPIRESLGRSVLLATADREVSTLYSSCRCRQKNQQSKPTESNGMTMEPRMTRAVA
jgi:hypothetical protein